MFFYTLALFGLVSSAQSQSAFSCVDQLKNSYWTTNRLDSAYSCELEQVVFNSIANDPYDYSRACFGVRKTEQSNFLNSEYLTLQFDSKYGGMLSESIEVSASGVAEDNTKYKAKGSVTHISRQGKRSNGWNYKNETVIDSKKLTLVTREYSKNKLIRELKYRCRREILSCNETFAD